MDRTKIVLDEIKLKAANSSDVYELIMNLLKEVSSSQVLPERKKNSDTCKFVHGSCSPGRC
jgi:CRISPR/Cas system CMR subunit Cmr4 (Cas7 group RAMP superfamily)